MSYAAAYRPGRYRPGIAGLPPLGAVVAAGVIALMGFYGFVTAVQKAAVSRQVDFTAFSRADNARAATATAPTPSMVYALTEAAPAPAAVTPRPPRVLPPEPVIDSQPTVVQLTAVPPPAPPVTVAPPVEAPPTPIALNAESGAANASSIGPAPPAEPEKIPN